VHDEALVNPGTEPGPPQASPAAVRDGELQALWQRAHAGDERAYHAALSHLAKRLRGYFLRRLSRLPSDVEDLVQETLMALHVKRGSYDPSIPVTAWVHAIAHHKLVDLYRRRGRREDLHEPIDDLDSDLHPSVEEEQPARRDLAQLLGRLPEAQRLAIVLTRIEGLSMQEASSRTGASVAALKVQVHRGLHKLSQLVRQAKD
jgi:RNA polymerase sigma-70 factor, ECF subfamily